MLSRRALAVLAVTALLANCDTGHARSLRVPTRSRRSVRSEAPADCRNLTETDEALWNEELSEEDVLALLSSHGGLPGDTDLKYRVSGPEVLPYLRRDYFDPDNDDGEDEEARKDVKDKDADKDAEEERKDENDKDDKPHAIAKEPDNAEEGGEEEGEDSDEVAPGLVDYFSDFYAVNQEESLKYNYSATDFTTFVRVERAISIPRMRLLQADPKVLANDGADLPEVVVGVVGELWWKAEGELWWKTTVVPGVTCDWFRNLVYVALAMPGGRSVFRFEVKEKLCLSSTVSLWCEGPDAAEPFDNQGSDSGLLIMEALLGLPVTVSNTTEPA